jgi:lipid II isoglutaminyl synthase (glutamine-hydrolysing)
MTEPVGRHASRDQLETLIMPAITGDAEPPLMRPAAGRHASPPRPDEPARPEAPTRAAEPARAGELAAAGVPSAAGQWQPPPVPEPAGQAPANGHGPEPGRNGHRAAAAPAQPPSPARQPAHASPGGRPVRLVWVYPDLLSTYGDRGNLLVLTRRAQLRGLDVTAVEVNSDQPVPADGDVYLLGGGEDLPQILAADRLRADGGLQRAAADGAVVFAVCAGYQLIGRQFGGVEGEPVAGLSILDVTSGRGERRGVGEIVADVDPALGVPRLTGFENHQGVTHIGPDAHPLARVALGVGNGDGTEGAYAGKVLGTYLHGPALARNPGLADLLLSWVAGPLAPLDDTAEDWARRLRAERLAATSS